MSAAADMAKGRAKNMREKVSGILDGQEREDMAATLSEEVLRQHVREEFLNADEIFALLDKRGLSVRDFFTAENIPLAWGVLPVRKAGRFDIRKHTVSQRPYLHGHDFFVKEPAHADRPESKLVWKATPLFLCLVVVELSDVMFAFDSIPAIIAITQDPFLVYTSNIFAILGLRSLYFLMAAAKRYLIHLEKAVIAILAFIGLKMLLSVAGVIHLSPMLSLAVVGGLLALGIVASLVFPERKSASGPGAGGSHS